MRPYAERACKSKQNKIKQNFNKTKRARPVPRRRLEKCAYALRIFPVWENAKPNTTKMKHIIILGDGMADWKIESLGNKTPLQYAYTPNMDKLAAMGRTGMLKTVPDGFHPGSEVANSAILGYDQRKVYEGRGPLEAASIGVELDDDDFALRCNLICVENEKIDIPQGVMI